MIYKDRIYGESNITEPVLIDLVSSRALERIKHVDQHGYFEQYFPGTAYSRFEHSMGVMVLLRRYHAPLEEQVAGLIHDVSHTVFSHAADFVFGTSEDQSFQDSQQETLVRSSDIPGILAKHRVELEYILDEHNFPLLETKLPDVCADRLDYSLREMYDHKMIDRTWLNSFFASLKVKDRRWFLEDMDAAADFVNKYNFCSANFWSGPKAVIMFTRLRNLIKYSLDKKYISQDDLFTTDNEVLKSLRTKSHEDQSLTTLLEDLDIPYEWVEDRESPDIVETVKRREIDPWVGDKKYSEIVSHYIPNLHPHKYTLKLIKPS